MTRAQRDLIDLTRCAVNGETPDASRVEAMDLAALYRAAERQMLTAAAAMALESAGVRDPAFTQAKGKAIRKNAALDEARDELCAAMDRAGIWYLPLKGAVLKDLYPRFGMRQMADNDILFDAGRAEDLRALMEGLGYTTEHFGGDSNHDVYHKEPIYNFELHRSLFHPSRARLYDYYADVKSRLVPDGNGGCGYRFKDEDFYVYLLAHEHKHFISGGAGLRSLLDVYVFLRARPDLDRDYLAAELEKLELTEFEAQQRQTAQALFSGRKLSEAEREQLDYMLDSGVFGTTQHAFVNRMNRGVAELGGGKAGKRRFVWRRLFLPKEIITGAYPFLDRHRWLIPLFSVWRLIHAALFRRGTIRKELDYLHHMD